MELNCGLWSSYSVKLSTYLTHSVAWLFTQLSSCCVLGVTGLSRKEQRKYADQKAQALGGKVGPPAF